MNGLPHYLLLTAVLTLRVPWRFAIPLSLLFWAPLQPHFIGIIRGAVGELSVGSMILTLLLWIKIFKKKPVLEHPGMRPTAMIIAIAGIFLYGNFLGILPLGHFHPYESGFSSPLPILAICLFAAIASWKGWLWPALWAILSLCVWLFKLHPSLNPWDCLMDGVLWIASIIITIRCLIFRNHDVQT